MGDPKLIDKKQVYEAEILPLVKQVTELCEKHSIPMLGSFQVNDEDCHIVYRQIAGESSAQHVAFHILVHRNDVRVGLFALRKV